MLYYRHKIKESTIQYWRCVWIQLKCSPIKYLVGQNNQTVKFKITYYLKRLPAGKALYTRLNINIISVLVSQGQWIRLFSILAFKISNVSSELQVDLLHEWSLVTGRARVGKAGHWRHCPILCYCKPHFVIKLLL